MPLAVPAPTAARDWPAAAGHAFGQLALYPMAETAVATATSITPAQHRPERPSASGADLRSGAPFQADPAVKEPAALESGPLPIQRYFELARASYEELGVSAIEGTSFPGHEEDAEHGEYLTPERTVNRQEKRDLPDLAVSDDGKMAIELAAVNSGREVEAFFADADIVRAGNETLAKRAAKFRLKPIGGQGVTVPDLASGARHHLGKVVGQQAPVSEEEGADERPFGPELIGPERCNEMAQEIIGKSGLMVKLSTGDAAIYNENAMREVMIQFLAGYIAAASKDERDVRLTKQAEYVEAAKKKALEPVVFEKVPRIVEEQLVTFVAYRDDKEKLKTELLTLPRDQIIVQESFIGADWTYVSGYFSWGQYEKAFKVTYKRENSEEFIRRAIDEHLKGKFVSYRIETKSREAGVDPERTALKHDEKLDAVIEGIQRHPEVLAEANRLLGLNEYAQPNVGEAFMIFNKGRQEVGQNFPYHFAAVVAKSGEDAVTLENYARGIHEQGTSGGSRRMYFQMYGPKREVAIQDGRATRTREGPADEQEAREYAAGSFHGRWKALFSEASTVGVKRG